MPVINIKNLNKKFGANEVLRDINLTVEKGEVVAIIGPSGSGKSTLLRCMNLFCLLYTSDAADDSVVV